MFFCDLLVDMKASTSQEVMFLEAIPIMQMRLLLHRTSHKTVASHTQVQQ